MAVGAPAGLLVLTQEHKCVSWSPSLCFFFLPNFVEELNDIDFKGIKSLPSTIFIPQKSDC